MGYFETNQNSNLRDECMGVIQSNLIKHKRTMGITRMVLLLLAVLFGASLLFNVDTHKTKTISINYEPLTADSDGNGYYHTDSIVSYAEVFETNTVTYMGSTRLDPDPSTVTTYYFATDKNGFSFFICAKPDGKQYIESLAESEDKDLILYGRLSKLPANLQIDFVSTLTSSPELTDKLLSGDTSNLYEDMKAANEELISFVNEHQILNIYIDPPEEKTVDDGLTPLYVILLIVRLLLVVAFIGLLIFRKKCTNECNIAVNYYIARLGSLKDEAGE